jgi:soluble P-type ATPase
MLEIVIPGFRHLALDTLVCDYNGTLARDGRLLNEVRARIARLAPLVRVKIITGDTFGTARDELATEALLASDIVVRQSADALDLLLEPRRLVATLRA